jgi:two-component system, LytTR family, sensor histidine kinase AlgZ
MSKRMILKNWQWVLVVMIGVSLILLENYEPLFSFLLAAYFIFVIGLGFVQVRSLLRLRNENKKASLMHLQSQINPHFLFNSLNNLYGLIDKDTHKAKAMVLRLSDMMRYGLYEGQKERVALEKETEYINAYIELHKARYHKRIDIQFTVQIQQKGITILPLLLIVPVENAFKHGVENLQEGAYVNIHLIASSNSLTFVVENNFDRVDRSCEPGIGLKNLKQRLELVYPNSHLLTISETHEIYTVQLIINRL